jgi:hypothetical protein
MQLTAPVYRLKRQAKKLSRTSGVPLHEALNTIALQQGFNSWSLLTARASSSSPSKALLAQLEPGDLVLLGARPGHGKTLLALELIAETVKAGRLSLLFSFEFNEQDLLERFQALGADPATFGTQFQFDNADTICADYIISLLGSAAAGSLVVVDYLQLLDQRRDNPDIETQIRSLRIFAKQRGLIMVFLSQIHRTFDPSSRTCPGLGDVRMPNPLNLSLFSRTCFLNDGVVEIETMN